MPDDPLTPQLRAWADDLAAEVGPVAAPATSAPSGSSSSGSASGSSASSGSGSGSAGSGSASSGSGSGSAGSGSASGSSASSGLGAASAGGGLRPPVVLLAAAVLVAVLGVAAVVAVAVGRDDPDEQVRTAPTTTDAPEPDVPLVGTTWWLDGLVVDGAEVPVADEANPSIAVVPCDPAEDCTGDTVLTGDDGCNRFSADVTVEPDTWVVGPVVATEAGCGDEASARLRELVRDEVGYAITGTRLTLAGGGIEATYLAGDATFPPVPAGATELASGADPEHRVTWRPVTDDGAPAVELEVVVRRDLLLHEATVVLAVDVRDGMAAVAIGTRPAVVAGLVDARAVEVTFEPHQGAPVTIPTTALPGEAGLRAFVAPVPAAAGPWTTTAVDAAGTVLATDTWDA